MHFGVWWIYNRAKPLASEVKWKKSGKTSLVYNIYIKVQSLVIYVLPF